MTAVLICPLCAGTFDRGPQTWRCTQGHSFDVAREGYVNLLPVQYKHSREPGDRPVSLASRRAFLDAGHYQPLREALVACVAPLHAHTLLDIGCGEGYYTGALATQVEQAIGLDIAKPAIRLAAKRFPAPTWIVGSGARLPIATASVDLVCSLFTPLHEGEMSRVLQPGGSVVLVTPAAGHLHAVRAQLFDTVQPHEPEKFRAGFEADFELVEQHTLCCPLVLTQRDLGLLLEMTPYAFKARPEKRAALEACADGLSTQAAFSIMRFRRCEQAPAR